MMKKKAIYILLSIVGLPLALLAQEQEKPIDKAKQVITNKFPASRFLDFEYEMVSPTNYDSKLHKEDSEKGEMRNSNRFKLSMNYPVYKTRRLVITPNIRYKYESLEFDDVENQSPNYPNIYHKKRETAHYISTSVNTTYISKLFNKPTMYSLSLTADASDRGYEYLTATLAGIMVLKKDAQTSMSVGLIVSIDKTSLIPVIPFFSYEYKFAGSQWVFDMQLPKQIYFRRPLFGDGRLSLGTHFEGNRFVRHPKYEGLNGSYNVIRRELKSGFMYEHYVNKHFILSLRGGVVNTMQWEVTKKNSRKTIIDYSPNMNMYFNVGFSYNL